MGIFQILQSGEIEMKCKQCNMVELSIGNIDGLCPNCRILNGNLKVGMSGWVCPVCGRGNSPFVGTCPCKPIDYKVTC